MSSYSERAARRAAASMSEPEVEHDLIPVVAGRGDVAATLAESSSRWLQVPEGGQEVEVVVASVDACRYVSHYVRRRHVPCLGGGRCRFCPATGSQPRWAMAVMVPGERRPWLWDCSGHVMEQVERVQRDAGAVDLAGLRLVLGRLGRARNSPIVVSSPEGLPFDDEAVLGAVDGEALADMVRRALASALRAVGS